MQNQTILEHLRDYLDYLNCKWLERGKKTCSCPICKENSGSIIKDTWQFSCVACKFIGNIYDLVKKLEVDMKDLSDEEIEDYLNYILQIQSDVNTEKALEMYQQLGFCLVPISPNGKEANIEAEWTSKEHRDIREWKTWLQSKLNIGIRTGKCSGITVIDIDFFTKAEKAEMDSLATTVERKRELKAKKVIPPEILDLLPATLIQETRGGFHYFIKYDADIPKTAIKIGHVRLDIENDGGQVVAYPSVVEGHKRTLHIAPIVEMPSELKSFLLKHIKKVPLSTVTSTITASEKDFTFDKLEGNCNNTMIQFGGILRKTYSIKEVERILNLVNNGFLNDPIKQKDLSSMVRELDKYGSADVNLLQQKIIEYLIKHEECNARDLQDVFKADKKDVMEALSNLIKDEKVYKQKSLYKKVKEMNWKDTFVEDIKPLNIEVPYFQQFAHFVQGDHIILGGNSGTGKCITNGYLCTNQGLIDIADLGKNRPYGMSKVSRHTRLFIGHGKYKSYRIVNYFYKERVNHTIRITTDYGFEIEGTPEHPIMIVDSKNNKSFKKLVDIQTTDSAYLVIPDLYAGESIHKRKITYKAKKRATNIKLDFDENTPVCARMAKLFGYIIGDGNLNNNRVSIYQDSKNKHITQEIVSILNFFKLSYKIDNPKPSLDRIMVNNAKFVWYLKTCLFETRKKNILSPNRHIPKRITRAKKDIQIAFISAVLDCESSLKLSKYSGNLEITMASKKIIDLMQIMLLNMGIICRKTLKPVNTYPDNKYYRLFFTSEMTHKVLDIIKPIKYCNVKFEQKYLTFKKIKYVGNNQHIKNTYIKDHIVKIEHIYKEQDVYDFNIENPHFRINNQFWSNGFVSHNTHLAMNFIKQFVEQGVKPYYYGTESKSRCLKIAMQLGLKEKDFWWDTGYEPNQIELKPNSICVLDWLDVEDFSLTGQVFKALQKKLDKSNGLLITMCQLNVNDTFYAEKQLKFYGAFVAKYLFTQSEKGWDTENTYFKVEKVRESKIGKQYFIIPTHYDSTTKIISMRG